MRRVLVLLAVLAVVVVGCSEERPVTPVEHAQPAVAPGSSGAATTTTKPLTIFSVDNEDVQVTDYSEDTATHRVSIDLHRILPSDEIVRYTYAVQRPQQQQGLTACGADLLDSAGQLLFGIRYQWEASNPHPDWISITERTLTDELSIVSRRNGSEVTETYTLNGVTRQFVYDDPNVPAMSRISPSGEPSDSNIVRVLRPKSKAVAELFAWEEFVSPENTLNNNADGRFFVLAGYNEDFARWGKQKFGAKSATNDLPAVCGLFESCALVKCPYGYFENPVCAACAGAFVVCTIIAFIISIW